MLTATMSLMRAPVAPVSPARNTRMREAAYKPGETAPYYLDGTMPGDVGCDPLCLVALATPVGVTPTLGHELATGSFVDRVVPFPWSVKLRQEVMSRRTPEEQRLTLEWMRESEIKHARLAMLAVIGWPLSELLNPFGSLAFIGGRAPSLFNGGLDAYAPFLLLATGAASFLEMQTTPNVNQMWCDPEKYGSGERVQQPGAKPASPEYKPGDLKFDPLGLAEKLPIDVDTAELYNGRLAMLAITGFAVPEFLWGTPVVNLPISGFFFGR
jgi:light-harvesting complex II chlorophyll a/b binding protein 4